MTATAKLDRVKKEILSEIAEDAYRDFQTEVAKAAERMNEVIPRRIFQEKHITGWLWWKRTYYTYSRYSEGTMIGVIQFSTTTIKDIEART